MSLRSILFGFTDFCRQLLRQQPAVQEREPPPLPRQGKESVCAYTCVFVCWVKPAPAHHAVAACSIQGRKIWMRCEIFRLELLRWSAGGGARDFFHFPFFFFFCGNTSVLHSQVGRHLLPAGGILASSPPFSPPPQTLNNHSLSHSPPAKGLQAVLQQVGLFNAHNCFFFFFYCVRAVRRQTARHTQEGIHPRPASFCHSLPFYSPFRQHEKQLNQHHFLSAAILLCSPPKKINPPPLPPGYPALHSGFIYHVAPGCSAHRSE